MSPTLLEAVVAIVLIVVAWQIGLAIAPNVLRLMRSLKRDLDDVTDEALTDSDVPAESESCTEEYTNESRR